VSKNILITGGAKRVGAQCVRYLHAQGHNILLHYRSSAIEAKGLADELNHERDDSVRLVQADLADSEALKGAFKLLPSNSSHCPSLTEPNSVA
jgi:pteridine reductase